METIPGVVWSGSFDRKLQELITVFASDDLPKDIELPAPYVRSLFFDRNTVTTLCHAAVKAEDALILLNGAGEFKEWRPTSLLTEQEKEPMFSTAHSPFYGPLVGLSNIADDFLNAKLRESPSIDLNVYICVPLKTCWSRLICHLWNHPSRSLGTSHTFEQERYLIPHIFCTVAEADRSFAHIIDDDSDLTISLITRYWIHATGEAEIVQLSIFFLLLFPRRRVPGSTKSERLEPLYVVPEGEPDPTLGVLRRILRDNDTIAKFVLANASHLRRFRGFEAKVVVTILEKLWDWVRSFKDPLCLEFLTVFRTSVPLWSGLFEASSRTTGNRSNESFANTLHGSMITLVEHVAHCDTPSEVMAMTELWVSTGIFDALDVILGEVIDHGTEEDQISICQQLATIYRALTYGPAESHSIAVLMRQQLPRPRTIRRLWDLSVKLSGSGIKNVVPCHAARVVVVALEMMVTLSDGCKRRGCQQKATARCAKCQIGYCGANCQKQDWQDHKRICCVSMDMEPAVKDEAFTFLAGADAMAQVKAERDLNF